MKIGIIAEGLGDCAVLQNILYGLDLIEKPDDVTFIRPRLVSDALERSQMLPEAFSNWTLVKKECIEKYTIEDFLGAGFFDDERIIIVHLDSAECQLEGYDVERPSQADDNYVEILRNRIIEKIKEWLESQFLEKVYFAIAIEETEAWLLALFNEKNTHKHHDPKNRFENLLRTHRRKDKNFTKHEKPFLQKGEFEKMKFYSLDFQKLKKKKIKTCLENNLSLKLFVESLPAV